MITYIDRTLDNSIPADAIAWIQVEDEAIRLFRVLQGGTPWMDLEHAGLNQGEKACQVLDRHSLVIADFNPTDQIVI